MDQHGHESGKILGTMSLERHLGYSVICFFMLLLSFCLGNMPIHCRSSQDFVSVYSSASIFWRFVRTNSDAHHCGSIST